MQIYLIIAGFMFTIYSELGTGVQELNPQVIPYFILILLVGIFYYIVVTRMDDSLTINLIGIFFAIAYVGYIRIFVYTYDSLINPDISLKIWPYIPLFFMVTYSLLSPNTKLNDIFSYIYHKIINSRLTRFLLSFSIKVLLRIVNNHLIMTIISFLIRKTVKIANIRLIKALLSFLIIIEIWLIILLLGFWFGLSYL